MFKRRYDRRDAADYLGMSPSSFDVEVAPFVPYTLVGRTGKRYDRLDLDFWLDQQQKIYPSCQKSPRKSPRVSDSGVKSGTSTESCESETSVQRFEKALAAARRKKQ